jgi:hypothetical protein
MTKQSHTPTPAYFFNDDGGGIYHATDSYPFAIVNCATMHSESDCAELVMRGNTHDALVAALRDCAKWMDNRRHLAEFVPELARALDALAAAEKS